MLGGGERGSVVRGREGVCSVGRGREGVCSVVKGERGGL